MDLESSPKSPDDTEIDTPPHGGASLKRRHHAPPVLYKECMRNHAAAIGGHAVDGCGEFMPPPSSAAGDLRCAACGCHRSFHRRGSPPAITPPFLDFRRPPPPKRFSLSPPTTAARPFFVEESQPAPVTPTAENPACRKRFRTRFSQEQKEKMHRFAAAMGWRMQKSDDAAVREFCREVGVTKGVLKVYSFILPDHPLERYSSSPSSTQWRSILGCLPEDVDRGDGSVDDLVEGVGLGGGWVGIEGAEKSWDEVRRRAVANILTRGAAVL
ncbi:Zinc-finger homeodomain protein 8 [Striga hermonthica]|uniref:Zinc-finger homeodomain protein 8 n=1 Tax=Striga hermonthica TaxID=68872 RepID=A0A9N7P487_STRHE|nr:Zinc-finger homeodomain protein 8 [Striga hermonthica]